MANQHNPCGLKPLRLIQPPTLYKAVTGVALFMYQPVDMNANGYVAVATPGSGNYILGSIVGMLDGSYGPINKDYGYIPANPSGVDASGYMNVLVADHPCQRFVIEEDTGGSALAATDRFAGANFTYEAATGNTISGISRAVLDRSTIVAGLSNQQFRLIGELDKPDNALGDYCKWEVEIYYHRLSPPTVGAGIATTV